MRGTGKHTYAVRGADRVSAGRRAFLREKQEGGTSVDARRSESGEHAHAVRIRGFEIRRVRYGPGAKKARPL